jgi:hypothetical protein
LAKEIKTVRPLQEEGVNLNIPVTMERVCKDLFLRHQSQFCKLEVFKSENRQG